MPSIVRVEPLTTARALRGPFDYRIPDAFGDVEVGTRLAVPFGGRRIGGVVVALAQRSEIEPERLVEPLGRIEPAIPAELVELALWLAREYCSTPARCLRLVAPPGAGGGTRPRVRERTALSAQITAAGRAALCGGARLTAGQRDALCRLQDAGPLPAAASALGHGGLRRLQARGLLELERRALRRAPSTPATGAPAPAEPPALTAEQSAALAPILAAIAGARPETGRDRSDGAPSGAPGAPHGGAAAPGGAATAPGFLLHGVTGSGKTEVYMRAAAAALERRRGVIVLVPEIALTPQTVARLRARFGETVALLHSRLGAGERYDEWARLATGEARVCVGPRSAVLAPVRDVGLIVVDEEHEASYKHEGDPRYDARTVAARRAVAAGAVLVCGSATPRPESFHALRRLALRRRVDGRALPGVELLDMRGHGHPLHPRTREALADVSGAGRKAIVLLNRRGWSNFLSCRACGHVWMCPECDVALVLHRDRGAVSCHHCGHRERAPSRCVACGASAVARHGAGTERIEHELAEALGGEDFPVLRLDADAAATRGGIERRLQRFDAAPAGALVGTQIVAKGHDFPDVALGVVLDADRTLRFPDFRAEERTFALIAQLAGRAGRGGHGRVLVQTLAPEAPSIQLAAAHDSERFLAGELSRREALRYPPFSSLIRVVCAGPRPGAAAAVANELRAAIAGGLGEGPGAAATVLGPAPLFRLRGRERSQLVLKARARRTAIAAVRDAVQRAARAAAAAGVSMSVDVDPQ